MIGNMTVVSFTNANAKNHFTNKELESKIINS